MSTALGGSLASPLPPAIHYIPSPLCLSLRFFSEGGASERYGCMAPSMVYERAFTRDDLVDSIQVGTAGMPSIA